MKALKISKGLRRISRKRDLVIKLLCRTLAAIQGTKEQPGNPLSDRS